jgi:hypothetical protein
MSLSSMYWHVSWINENLFVLFLELEILFLSNVNILSSIPHDVDEHLNMHYQGEACFLRN